MRHLLIYANEAKRSIKLSLLTTYIYLIAFEKCFAISVDCKNDVKNSFIF